jgi:disulfide bond formation protein DsbB
MAGLVRFGNGLGVAGIALVLLVAFVLQFVQKELPCPLCNLQRVAFVLCGFGFLLNLRFGSQPAHYGVTILAALFGLAVSGRQVLLHIVPGDAGYGQPLMGLHLYTWTFVFFLSALLGVAVLLVLSSGGRVEHERLAGGRHAQPFGVVARFAAWFLIFMTLGNAAASFALCGPIECPDNPTDYWLLQLLGR